MKSWKPNLGSLDPQLKSDLLKFSSLVRNGNTLKISEFIDTYKSGHDAFGNEITNIDIVNYRLDPPYQDSLPLRVATVYERYNSVKLLLDEGANIDEVDSNGNTVLMVAIQKVLYDIVKLLVSRGANISIQNNKGDDAFGIACELVSRGEAGYQFVEVLIDSVKDPKIKKQIATEGLLMITSDIFTRTKTSLVNIFLDAGADVNIKSQQKNPLTKVIVNTTPLMYVAQKDEDLLVDLFIKKGADINAKDFRGDTALIIAIKSGSLDSIKALINYGAEFGEKEERLLRERYPQLLEQLRKTLQQQKIVIASDIIQKELPNGQYMEAQTQKDLAEYMDANGGKRRKRNTKRRKSNKKKMTMKRKSKKY